MLNYDDSHRSVVEGNVSRVQGRDNELVVKDKYDAWLFTFKLQADDICIPYSTLVILLDDVSIKLSFKVTPGTIKQYQKTAKKGDSTTDCIMTKVC